MITAEVKNSAEDFNAFYSFWKKEKNLSKNIFILLVLCLVLGLIIAFSSRYIFEWQGISSFILIFSAALFLVCLIKGLRLVFFLSKPKFAADDKKRRLVFEDEQFIRYSDSDTFHSEFFAKYDLIDLAAESADRFFIVSDKIETCIICKDQISGGSPDELRLLLQQKIGDRFKQIPDKQ